MPEGGDREEAIRAVTAQTMALLEAKIRRYPDQYPWTYHLWRDGLDVSGDASEPEAVPTV